jgi:DNA helicase II / ATP-dependent DNA helicase PcrA
MKNLLTGLNKPQIDAVKAFDGAFLVIAGAGSGKTTALTRRIAYLIREYAVSPHQILAVTFTNKAAAEMRARVAQLIDMRYSQPLVGTFHSVCVRILREEIVFLDYEKNFSILDQHDQLVLIKKIIKELDLVSPQFSPRAVLENISRAKNALLTEDEFAGQVGSYHEEKVARVYAHYQRMLRQNHSLDFDDIIRLTIMLFDRFPLVLQKYQERFRYVLVDEYQDTNHAQYRLIKLLTQKHGNLFVVGDDWQSIYKWRGADVGNILNFEKDYPDATVIKLEQNYRSTQNILDVAFHVIKHNAQRSNKAIWTNAGGGKNLVIYEANDERDESSYVVQKIRSLKKEGYQENDFVILYRTNAQSRIVEEMLLKEGISYRIVGGIKFYERKEVKDIIAHLRIVANHADILSLERALSAPKRGIGNKTFMQWLILAREKNMDPISYGIQNSMSADLAQRKKTAIAQFCHIIHDAKEYAQKHTLSELITFVYEKSGYKAWINDGTIEGEMRHENVQELFSVALKYDGIDNALVTFIEEVSLASDTDHIDQNKQMVHLMTLHSAKGLEFPVVFMIGLEEGLIPHSRAMVSEEEMEEERRLTYVGITRAKERVYFIHTRQRILFGTLQMNMPSRFYDDMPQHLVDKEQSEIVVSYRDRSMVAQPKVKSVLHPVENNAFVDGDKVFHPQFGDGIVVAQTDTIIHVVFKKEGLKKLAKSIAPLTKK